MSQVILEAPLKTGKFFLLCIIFAAGCFSILPIMLSQDTINVPILTRLVLKHFPTQIDAVTNLALAFGMFAFSVGFVVLAMLIRLCSMIYRKTSTLMVNDDGLTIPDSFFTSSHFIPVEHINSFALLENKLTIEYETTEGIKSVLLTAALYDLDPIEETLNKIKREADKPIPETFSIFIDRSGLGLAERESQLEVLSKLVNQTPLDIAASFENDLYLLRKNIDKSKAASIVTLLKNKNIKFKVVKTSSKQILKSSPPNPTPVIFPALAAAAVLMLPGGYTLWTIGIWALIRQSKVRAEMIGVLLLGSAMLDLYFDNYDTESPSIAGANIVVYIVSVLLSLGVRSIIVKEINAKANVALTILLPFLYITYRANKAIEQKAQTP